MDYSHSIGPIMKAARKFKKLNQADVADAIGCSQSALSKMEHNLLVPSAPQWFLFARFTSIPPESIETGVIDRHSKIKFNNDQVSMGFKLPKKYKSQRSEKVRELFPFLLYLERNHPELYKNFLLNTNIDAEFFLDFDNLINFQLIIDTIQFFIENKLYSNEIIEQIVVQGQNDVYWKNDTLNWKKFKTPADVLQEYVNEQSFFQNDFILKIKKDGYLALEYSPEYHLRQVLVPDSVIDYINIYRRYSLENLLARVLNFKVQVKLYEGPLNYLEARFDIAA
ncbi:MAG: helix-turn-helix domain-containing protein [Bacteriovoracaceae bacterium]